MVIKYQYYIKKFISFLLTAALMVTAVLTPVMLPAERAYAETQSKIVTDSRTSSTNSFPGSISYSSGGYSGSLSKNGAAVATVVSGYFIPGENKNVTGVTYNSGTNFPPSSYVYNSGGFTGTLSRYDYRNNRHQDDMGRDETRTVYRTFDRSHSNTVTQAFSKTGQLLSTTYSWGGTDNHPSLSINEDGYVGSIPRVSASKTSGPTRSNNADGSYTITDVWTGYYSGTLSKTVTEWVPNLQWVDDYTGYYSGTVTKPAFDNRVWSYTQNYRGCVYTTAIAQQNYGTPKQSESVNEPVNIVTGNYYSSDTDMTITDLGPSLVITRYYNSLDNRSGIIGKGWRLSYESSIEIDGPNGNVRITYPDGHVNVFEPISGSNSYNAPENVFDRLEKQSDGTYTLNLQQKLTYTYGVNGKLSKITDRNGNSITITYDSAGMPASVKGAGGKEVLINSESGKVKAITDPIGRTIEYSYDAAGNLSQVKAISGSIRKYEYVSGGLRSITDENGKTFIINEYDQFKRVIQQYDEQGNIIEYNYDDANLENTYTFLSTGKSYKYRYDERLYITRKTFDDGTYEEYTYDNYGNRNSVRDRNGNITYYTFDARGNVTEVKSPEPFNYITRYTYDSNDNLTSVTTPAGGYTSFEYDGKGNLISTIQKLEESLFAETTFEYDANGRLVTVIDPENNVTKYEYDASSQPVKIIDPESNQVEYGYDAVGRNISITTGYGATTLTFNSKDKVEKIEDASGGITRMKYDPVGNLVKMIKPEQYNTSTDDGTGYSYAYDAMDRLIRQIDPLGAVSAFQYDEEGNKIKYVNPNYYDTATKDGTGIGYEFDGSSRLVTKINPSGEKSRIKYDAVGNIKKIINADNYDETSDNGPGIEYSYDSLNRLIEVKDAYGNVTSRLLYDADGRVIKEIDAKGYLSGSTDSARFGTLYKYNLAGWLTEVRKPLSSTGNNILYAVTLYKYDKIGKVVEEKKSSQNALPGSYPEEWNTISYTYYKNGPVKTISDTTGALMEYRYDCLGNTTEKKVKINDSLWNITGYTYDKLGRISSQWVEVNGVDIVKCGSGTVKSETGYEYDKNGNITKITSPEGYKTLLEYDSADRLITKSQEVSVDSIDINGASLSISSVSNILYNGNQYQYFVELQTETSTKGIKIGISYDARMLEVSNINSSISGILTDTATSGIVRISADGTVAAGKNTLAVITFKVKSGIEGTGCVGFTSDTSFTGQDGVSSKFSELTGKSFVISKPDMNGDGKVETDDFTLTALKYGISKTNPEFNEKYDINGNGIIDLPDLDSIKDALFSGLYNTPSNKLSPEKFSEKKTNASYKSSTRTEIRTYSYEYDKAGNLIKETDSNGCKMLYDYDELNRMIRITDKTGSKTRLFYNEEGNLIKKVLPSNYDMEGDTGSGENYSYDAMNRLVEVRNAFNEIVERNIYEASGLLVKKIDGTGYLSGNTDTVRYGTVFEYDIGGRLSSIATPGAVQKGKTSECYTYDALGNVLTVTDGEGNITAYERDLWGRVTKVTDANGGITTAAYDYIGNITTVTDARGNTTAYSYNSMNLLSDVTDPMGGKTTYKYDLEGRISRQTDRSGLVTDYSYNQDGNVTNKEAIGTNYYEKYMYNKDGSLLAAINGSGVDTFEYTPDNLIKEHDRNGKKVASYEYNVNRRVASITDSFGRVTGYSYDAMERLNEVAFNGKKTAVYSYNLDNTVRNYVLSANGLDYNQGITVAYAYDRDKNITSIVQNKSDKTALNTFSYTYDNNGNRLSETRNGKKTSYEYDSLKQLVKAVYPGVITEDSTYDAVGNRTGRTKGGESTSYTYDNLNRLTNSKSNDIITAYGYDLNGNLINETTEDKVKSYSYDSFNRLTEVTNPDGTWQGNVYDTLGMRSAILENGIWTGFGYYGGNVISEQDAKGKSTASYIRGLGLIAQADGKGKFGYYLNNAHGDVAGIVDAAGAVLNSYTYDAYGNLLDSTEKVANRFTYSGEQFDSVTGQYYLRARYYNPVIGRFMQEDTLRGDILAPLSMNLYAYVSNNPVNMIDPTGHKEKCDAGPVVGPSMSYDQYVNEQKNGQYTLTGISEEAKLWQKTDYALSYIPYVSTINNFYIASSGYDLLGAWYSPGEQQRATESVIIDVSLTVVTGAGSAILGAIKYADDGINVVEGTVKSAFNGIETSTLKNVATTPGKGGVSPVGRAFQKHAGDASRAGTFTGEVTGNAAKNTQQGAAYLDEILSNPNTTSVIKNTKAYGDVLEVRMPDGTGALWSADGTKFIGFREKFTPTK